MASGQCPDAELLFGLIEGRLEDAPLAAVERHLASCEDCQRVVAAAVRGGAHAATAITIDGGASARGEAEPSRVGRRYVLIERLGRGGMGTVYAAWDRELTRRVALKILHPGVDQERFQREAQALARLKHPSVVTVYDVGLERGEAYLTMELIEGESLRRWLEREPRPWAAIVAAFVAAGRGLAAAHAAGLVHRDFKPDNVLVSGDGSVRVVDFGLVRNIDERAGARAAAVAAISPLPVAIEAVTDRLTATGTVLGTPRYMAPEQRAGVQASPSADQYSFCVALWEALFGEHPVLGDPRGRAAASRPPARVRAALRRGLAARAQERWPSMEPLLRALDPGHTGARQGFAALAAAAAITAAIALWPQERGAARACAAAADGARATVGDEARTRLRAAFQASGQIGAAAAADGTLAVLDRYAAALAGMTGEACRAARVRRVESADVYELRAGCLLGRQRGLKALVAELGRADAATVQRAEEAARALPPIAACADVDALSAPIQVPPERAQRAPVAAVRAALAEVNAMLGSGRYVAGLVRAAALLPLAQLTRFAPLTAETLLALGTAQSAAERPGTQEILERALLAAQAAGHDLVLARAAIGLANAGVRGGSHIAEARSWLALAEATLARAGAGRERDVQRGNLERVRAMLSLEETKGVEAEEHARRAVTLLLGNAPESRELYQARSMLAKSLHSQRKLAAAEVAIRETIAQALRTGLGPADVGRSHDVLGLVLMDLGRFPEAVQANRHALELMRAAYGPESRIEGMVENNYAILLANWGKQAEAAPYMTHSREILERTVGPMSPKLGTTLTNEGRMLTELGRYPEARVALERARDIFLADGGEEDFRLITAFADLAKLEAAEGRYGAAQKAAERAAALAAARGIHDATWVMAQNSLAAAHADRPRVAFELYRRALAASDEVSGAGKLDNYLVRIAAAEAAARAGERRWAWETLGELNRRYPRLMTGDALALYATLDRELSKSRIPR